MLNGITQPEGNSTHSKLQAHYFFTSKFSVLESNSRSACNSPTRQVTQGISHGKSEVHRAIFSLYCLILVNKFVNITRFSCTYLGELSWVTCRGRVALGDLPYGRVACKASRSAGNSPTRQVTQGNLPMASHPRQLTQIYTTKSNIVHKFIH